MDTPTESAPAVKDRLSGQLTVFLGLAVLVIGIVFAIKSSWYQDW